MYTRVCNSTVIVHVPCAYFQLQVEVTLAAASTQSLPLACMPVPRVIGSSLHFVQVGTLWLLLAENQTLPSAG